MKIKRILSAFLAGAVVLGSMAIPAFADETTGTTETTKVAKVGNVEYATLQEAVTAAAGLTENGKKTVTVELLSNTTGGGLKIGEKDEKGNEANVEVNKKYNIAIEFKGYTYTINNDLVGSSGTPTNAFQLLKGSKVTMKNGTIITDAKNLQIVFQNYCDLTLENMTVEDKGGSTPYILSCNYGDTVLKNVNFSAANKNVCAIDLMHWENNSYNDYPPTIVIDNDKSNTIKGKIDVYCWTTERVYTKNCIPRLAIKGGTFSADVKDYVIGNRNVTNNQDGTYTVEFAGNTIAKIDSTGYTSLQAAVDAASATDTIVLESDIYEPADSAATVNGKTVTINLNNHNVKASGYDGVFYVGDGGDLTIEGEGTVTALEYKKYAMGAWANGTGIITIENGNFNQEIKGKSNQYDMIYASKTGVINIKGGKFESGTPKWTLNLYDKSKPAMNVSGGTFVGYDPAKSETEPNGITSFVADGYVSVANDDGTYSVELREEGFGKVAVLTKGLDDKGNALLVLFTGINYLDYKNAGFKVNFADEEKEVTTTTVYTKVNVNDKDVTASFGNSKYIFGAELVLDKKYAGKSFTITPFATVVNKDSEVVSADKATTVGVYSEGNSDQVPGGTP